MAYLKELRTQHKTIAHLLHLGDKPDEIATKLDMAISSVYAITSDPLFKSYVAALDDESRAETVDIRKKLAVMAAKAIQKVDEKMDSNDEAISLRASFDTLDRAGFGAVKMVHAVNDHRLLSDRDLTETKARMEVARRAGLIAAPLPTTEISAFPSDGGNQPITIDVTPEDQDSALSSPSLVQPLPVDGPVAVGNDSAEAGGDVSTPQSRRESTDPASSAIPSRINF